MLNPPVSQDVLAQYRAARENCALAVLEDWSTMRFSGPDCGKFLQGLMTSDVLGLAEGQSGWSCLLTAKGRIRAHVLLIRREGGILAVGPKKALDNMAEDFGRVIMLSQTKMARAEELASPWLLVGPQADKASSCARDFGALALRDERFDLPAWLILAPQGKSGALLAAVSVAAGDQGLAQLEAQVLEMLRLESGIPAFGPELNEDVFPQEAGIENAVSLNKGCYLGQEIMSRLSRRGHVNRLLVRLKIVGDETPAAGAKIFKADHESGAVTSAAYSPREKAVLVLAFVRREDAQRGTRLELFARDVGQEKHSADVL